MDYEEKYEQAMFRMNKWAEGSEITDPKEVAEFVFPELKENEDERVKAEIIAFVEQSIHRGGGTPIPQEQENRWLAWLEKQGEQKPKDKPKFKVGDWITNGACTIQITSVDDTYYWHDNDCVGGDIESMDKEYHFWTIQDAKK